MQRCELYEIDFKLCSYFMQRSAMELCRINRYSVILIVTDIHVIFHNEIVSRAAHSIIQLPLTGELIIQCKIARNLKAL